jgi:hypothetical protein
MRQQQAHRRRSVLAVGPATPGARRSHGPGTGNGPGQPRLPPRDAARGPSQAGTARPAAAGRLRSPLLFVCPSVPGHPLGQKRSAAISDNGFERFGSILQAPSLAGFDVLLLLHLAAVPPSAPGTGGARANSCGTYT